jgi:hypothetical protein
VFGTIGIVLVLLFVILLLAGRGHGPSRHTSPGNGPAATHRSAVAIQDHETRPP